MDDVCDLHDKNCIPCKGGIPPFAISEIHKYLKKINGWNVKKNDNANFFLEKDFKKIEKGFEEANITDPTIYQ